MDIQRVGVVGCGLIGSVIAEAASRARLDVAVVEFDHGTLARGRERVATSIEGRRKAGKLTESEARAAIDRIDFSSDIEILADRQVVVEAVVGPDAKKVAIFERVDTVVESTDAVLASSASGIPIIKLAMATVRPTQVIGIHFFNPTQEIPIIELVPSLVTSDETTARAHHFATHHLGNQVIRAQDRAGFIVNALLIPYLLSAVRMVESGFATAEDIDKGMVNGCVHPMGPLRMVDLIGVDVIMTEAQSLYREFKEPRYAPPPLLDRMAEAGLLGRKSGSGFYDYGA